MPWGRLAGRYGAKRVVLGSLIAWIGVLLAAFFLQTGAVSQFYALAAVIGDALLRDGSRPRAREDGPGDPGRTAPSWECLTYL